MYCKTIILSNCENSSSNSPKGILTLSNQNNTTIGKIRLYNILSLPQGTKIGIYVNEQVYIANITKRPQHYEFDLDKSINIDNAIYCALIDNSKGDKKVVLEGGSFNGFYFSDSPFDAILENKDEELESTIDNAMKQSSSCPCEVNCSECEYKKYFYNTYNKCNNESISSPSPNESDEDLKIQSLQNDLTEDFQYLDENSHYLDIASPNHLDITPPSKKDESLPIDLNNDNTANDGNIDSNAQSGDPVKTEIDSNLNEQSKSEESAILSSSKNIQTDNSSEVHDEQNQFLNDIIYQLDEMFVKYPSDEVLNSIIPDSRFIKVDENGSHPYVLGIIYENKMMKYISYGVPAKYNSLPPSDLGQNYQWLPLNPEDVMSDGYYLIYQNALTGKIVDLAIE